MNKKIKHYSALALATATVIPMACKKDSNSADIEDKIINKVIGTMGDDSAFYGEDSIDVNGDGQFDFGFIAKGGNYYGPYAESYGFGINVGNDFVTNEQTFGMGGDIYLVTPKNSGDKISSASSLWTYYGFLGFKQGPYEFGSAGSGDKSYGFRFKVGANTHYGWIKVNLADDYKSLTVKEYAYHKTPNTEIAVGAK
jgi:hypothetical protein